VARGREDGPADDWLAFVPPGGVAVLAGVVLVMAALAAKAVGLVTALLLLLAAGLVATGFGVMQRLQQGGTASGTKLTGGVLLRLLGLLGLAVVLFGASVALVGPDERGRIDEPFQAPTAPGGGLPDGVVRDPRTDLHVPLDQNPPPYPWLAFTYLIVLFLGVVLTLLVAAGLLLKWAVRQQFDADEESVGEAQTSSILLLGVAAVVLLLGYVALDPRWDSGRSFLCVLSAVTLVGGMIVVVPVAWRKGVASLLIVWHFAGITAAVTTVEPPNAPPSWVATKLWTVVFRPYLQWTYMNNAYHFYSPEPGPASLMWARLEYDGGGYQWVKLPRREHGPVQMTYQRILAINESLNQSAQVPPPLMQELAKKRKEDWLLKKIPLHPEMPEPFQYREPNPYAKKLAGSYVRHLAREYPTREDRDLKAVKLYRVTHSIATAQQLANVMPGGGRQHADDPWLYMPYYLGEFDPAGRLLGKDGKPLADDNPLREERDPLLYWLIPILPDVSRERPDLDRTRLLDFLAVQAGDRASARVVKERP